MALNNTQKPVLRERTDSGLVAFMTSDQETERVYSYNPGTRTGRATNDNYPDHYRGINYMPPQFNCENNWKSAYSHKPAMPAVARILCDGAAMQLR